MVGVASPRKYHLPIFCECVLVCSVSSSLPASISWTKLTLADLVISLLTDSMISCSLEWIRVDCRSSCAASWCSNYHIMVWSTMNFSDFCIQKGKYHLRRRNYLLLLLVLITILGIFFTVLSSIVRLNINIRHCLLLPSQLAKIVTSHRVHETTGGKK